MNRGSITILAMTGVLTLCLFALGAADLGAMVTARARAQAAADAAALAAAVAQVEILGHPDDPASVAQEEAGRNGARVTRCECEPGDVVATVWVELLPRLTLIAPWFDRPARAVARAAVDPDVLSYRDDG